MAFSRFAGRGLILSASVVALVSACGSRSSDELDLIGSAGSVSFAGTLAIGGRAQAGSSSTLGGGTASGGAISSTGGSTSASGGSFGIGGDGVAVAGMANGGMSSGGVSSGGVSSGGVSSGGVSSGGVSSGGEAGAVEVAGAPAGGSSTTGGSASGGAAMGGSASGGMSSTAGAGGTGFTCPTVAPVGPGNAPVACMNPNEVCSYTGERCTCQRQGRGGNLAWACVGSGDACPSTEPADNSTCRGNLTCPYANGEQCNCQRGQWNCFTPGCPTAKPMPGSNCGAVAGQCRYGSAGACVCVQGGWFCN